MEPLSFCSGSYFPQVFQHIIDHTAVLQKKPLPMTTAKTSCGCLCHRRSLFVFGIGSRGLSAEIRPVPMSFAAQNCHHCPDRSRAIHSKGRSVVRQPAG